MFIDGDIAGSCIRPLANSEEMENEVPQEQWTMVCNYTPVYREEDYPELFESALWTPVGVECGPKAGGAAYHACEG